MYVRIGSFVCICVYSASTLFFFCQPLFSNAWEITNVNGAGGERVVSFQFLVFLSMMKRWRYYHFPSFFNSIEQLVSFGEIALDTVKPLADRFFA